MPPYQTIREEESVDGNCVARVELYHEEDRLYEFEYYLTLIKRSKGWKKLLPLSLKNLIGIDIRRRIVYKTVNKLEKDLVEGPVFTNDKVEASVLIGPGNFKVKQSMCLNELKK